MNCMLRTEKFSYKYLSYPLSNLIPAYGKPKTKLNIDEVKSILKGDSCNTYRFPMENHWGTHMDTPAHFFQAGHSIIDYPADECIFNKPYVLEIEMREDEIIEASMVQ